MYKDIKEEKKPGFNKTTAKTALTSLAYIFGGPAIGFAAGNLADLIF